jgi:hypothetical protein
MKTRKNFIPKLSKNVKKYVEYQINKSINDARIFKGVEKNKNNIWKTIHIGGSRKSIEVSSYIFKYDETNDTIIGISKKTSPCFFIGFSKEFKEIDINISFFSDCCHNEGILLPDKDGIQIMLTAVMKLIFMRKDIEIYTKIKITDNSGKNVSSDNKKSIVNLADMYYICTGCTWYSSLIPMFLQKESEYNNFINYRTNIIGEYSLTWNELLDNVSEVCASDLENIRKIYNENNVDSPGSASHILNIIRINRKYSYIFYNFIEELLNGFMVSPLSKSDWIIPLDNGKIVVCDDDPIQISCKNKGKWLVPDNFLKKISLNEWEQIRTNLQDKLIPSPFQQIVTVERI